MPNMDGRLLYTELFPKYSLTSNWREVYAAYLDHRMSPDDEAQFAEDFLNNEKLLSIILLRLIDTLKDMNILKAGQ